MVEAPPGVPEPTTKPKSSAKDWSGSLTPIDDPINPKHYESSAGQQLIDVIEEFGLADSFHLATALTYIFRAGRKPGTTAYQDIEKAIWYLKRFNEFHGDNNEHQNKP